MEQFERFDIITDRGGELVEIQNLADGDTCWVRRARMKRWDGCWIKVTDRQYELLTAARKRAAAKAAAKLAAKCRLPEVAA